MKDLNKQKRCASYHGAQRLTERTQCKTKNTAEFIDKVWKTGHRIESYNRKSRMFSYLTNVRLKGGSDRDVRVKGNVAYIFNKSGSVLITCFNIPQGVIQNKNKREWSCYNG